jgi:schlafen family protein
MSTRQLVAREEQTVTDEIQNQLKTIYTPGTPITTPALFAGRHQLLAIAREARGAGMNYVIQGSAGLGKTSVARQLFSGPRCFWHTASGDTDFVSIFLAMLLSIDDAVTETERTRLTKAGVAVGADAIGTKAEFGTELNVKQVQVAAQKLDLNFVLDRVVKHQRQIDSIVIDEFQRIKDSKIHTQVVEVIKGLADRAANVTVALVGITSKGEELVKDPDYPRYLGRHVTVITLRPMTQSEALEIFKTRDAVFGVAFPLEIQQKISWISCGYPYVVHKLALNCCFAWLVRRIGQLISNSVVPWFRKHILRRKEIRVPDVKALSVVIEPDDLISSVRKFVNEYEGNHPRASETLQGLGEAEREQILSGGVEDIEVDDQYFPCYGRAKEYLKSPLSAPT